MLLGYIWLLGTFVNSSCDIKININIVQNCCRNLAVRGLTVNTVKPVFNIKFRPHLHSNFSLNTSQSSYVSGIPHEKEDECM